MLDIVLKVEQWKCGYKERPKQVVEIGVKGSGGKKQIKQNICGNAIMKPTPLMLI